MSSSTRVRIVQDYFDALNKEDREGALVGFSEDATFHVVSPHLRNEIHGLANWREHSATRPMGEMHYEPTDIREILGCVIVKVGGKYTGEFKGDKEFLPLNLYEVFRFEDDKVAEFWVFE